MAKVEIVGPIGVEQHVLISDVTEQKSTKHDKSLAANIIDTQWMIGGSSTFAQLMYYRMGIEFDLITSIGADDLLAPHVLQAIGKFHHGQCRIARRGLTNFYLSVWDARSGRKQLYCRNSSNVTLEDILQHHSDDLDAVIFYGLLEPDIMTEILRLYRKTELLLSLVPNQTILQYRDMLEEMLSHIDLLFINFAEAQALTKTRDLSNTTKRLYQLLKRTSSHSSICITHGKQGLTIVNSDGTISQCAAPEVEILFALGGGDMLAAAVTAFAAEFYTIEEACIEAVRQTAAALKIITPFKGENELSIYPTINNP